MPQFKEHGAVILATGGYAADFTGDSLLKKHRPEYYDLVSILCHNLGHTDHSLSLPPTVTIALATATRWQC
jgi:hypothetical protein